MLHSLPQEVSGSRRRRVSLRLKLAALAAIGWCPSCGLQPSPDSEVRGEPLRAALDAEAEATDIGFSAGMESLAPLSTPSPKTESYRMGPGDELRIDVLGRPELSGPRTIGPDGAIVLPLVGTFDLSGLTREQAAMGLTKNLTRFFDTQPSVAIDVTRYTNNKVYVLGRVELPGVVELTGSGSLLQVLSEAGGLPVREFRSFLARAAIIRGRDEILWIDMLELLRGGNLALNVPLRNGDVVYVPDSEDTLVFVMGEVTNPGAVPIKARLDLMQALARSGGPTENADLSHVWLIRQPNGSDSETKRGPIRIDVERLIETADFTGNCQLRAGDVIYVSRSGWGDVNYVLRTLGPAFNALTIGAALTSSD